MYADLRKVWVKLLRLGFHLLYNQFAWTYDAVSWTVSFGAWRDWQSAALPFIRGPFVLEIAHGPGHMLLALRKMGFQAVGIDLSPNMGALSRDRLRKAGYAAALLRGKAQHLPFKSQLFDSVLVTFPTDFLVANETLEAVQSVLKPDGRFVIVPEARFTSGGLSERVIERLYAVTGQRNLNRGNKTGSNGPSDETRWDPLQQTFLAAGFQLEVHSTRLYQSEVTILLANKSDLHKQGNLRPQG